MVGPALTCIIIVRSVPGDLFAHSSTELTLPPKEDGVRFQSEAEGLI